jgi:hypothetical protein
MYEPFSNLSLPIPGSNSILLSIQIFCLPPEVRQMLRGPAESDVLGKRSIEVSIYIDQNEKVENLVARLKGL